MPAPPPALDYPSPWEEPPTKLTLEEAEGSVRVIFGVAPKWLCFAPFVASVIAAVAKAMLFAFALNLYVKMFIRSRFPTTALTGSAFRLEFLAILIGLALTPVFWSLAAIYHLYMYKHWDRVPRVLTASHEGLTLSWLGSWRMRERRWPTDEIKSIELRPVRGNLNWRRTVADLRIEFKTTRRRVFRLSSADPTLPGRIVECMQTVLMMNERVESPKKLGDIE